MICTCTTLYGKGTCTAHTSLMGTMSNKVSGNLQQSSNNNTNIGKMPSMVDEFSQAPQPTRMKRKRIADSFSRVASALAASRQRSFNAATNASTTANTSEESKGNALKSASAFVSCPLCCNYSAKKFGRGRGLAAHLSAVHTPWAPSKLAQKIARRQWEQSKRRQQRQLESAPASEDHQYNASNSDSPLFSPSLGDQPPQLKPYTPSQQERDHWEHRVLEIMRQSELDEQHFKNRQQLAMSNSSTTIKLSNDKPIESLDRSGKPLVSYKESLPSFLKAAAQGNLKLLQHMIQSAANDTKAEASALELLNLTDRHGSLAEHWAAGGGHLDCLKLLLEAHRTHRISVSNDSLPHKKRRRRDGKTCLHYAARNGHLHCVQYLVEVEGFDINEHSGDGTTPLHMACYGGHLNVVMYLVSSSRDQAVSTGSLQTENNITSVSNSWGCSSAHWVAMTLSQDVHAVSQLCSYLQVDCGVDFSARQHQGHSPLHKAAQKRNEHILRWMSKHLSPDLLTKAAAPDNGGHTPSDIWRDVGGSEVVANWMESLGW